MRQLAALCGALLLTLTTAAPAAANQKVWVEMLSGPGEWGPIEVTLDPGPWTDPEQGGNDWACTESIWYYGQWQDNLWLWYANDETDLMPVGRAWPWIKGHFIGEGTDAFAGNAAMTEKPLAGRFKFSVHIYDHVVDNPEIWKEQRTGTYWGLNIPGHGTVFHDSGNLRYTIVQTFEPGGGDIIDFDVTDIRFKGNATYDLEELCDYYHAGPPVFLP
jgi:hypothetical protein